MNDHHEGGRASGDGAGGRFADGDVRPGLEDLLRERESAQRAVLRGDSKIAYRGRRIEVEDDERGGSCVLDGRTWGDCLEDVFAEIDELAGSSWDEIELLEEAWYARLGDLSRWASG